MFQSQSLNCPTCPNFRDFHAGSPFCTLPCLTGGDNQVSRGSYSLVRRKFDCPWSNPRILELRRFFLHCGDFSMAHGGQECGCFACVLFFDFLEKWWSLSGMGSVFAEVSLSARDCMQFLHVSLHVSDQTSKSLQETWNWIRHDQLTRVVVKMYVVKTCKKYQKVSCWNVQLIHSFEWILSGYCGRGNVSGSAGSDVDPHVVETGSTKLCSATGADHSTSRNGVKHVKRTVGNVGMPIVHPKCVPYGREGFVFPRGWPSAIHSQRWPFTFQLRHSAKPNDSVKRRRPGLRLSKAGGFLK